MSVVVGFSSALAKPMLSDLLVPLDLLLEFCVLEDQPVDL